MGKLKDSLVYTGKRLIPYWGEHEMADKRCQGTGKIFKGSYIISMGTLRSVLLLTPLIVPGIGLFPYIFATGMEMVLEQTGKEEKSDLEDMASTSDNNSA